MTLYLQNLLKETKTVIIPGFGALTVTNEATGEIMFMPYLKFDDGTLTKHIMEHEACDLAEAKNSVSKFVNEVNIVLEKGGSFQMRHFGAFSMKDGEIVFETEQATTETKTEVPVAITPVVELEPEPIQELPIEEVIEPIVEETPLIEEQIETAYIEESPEKEPEIIEQPIIVEPSTSIPSVETTLREEAQNDATEETTVEDQMEPEIVPHAPTPIIENKEKTEETAVEIKPLPEEKTIAEVIPPVVEKKSVSKAKTTPETSSNPKKKKTGVLSYIIYGIIVLILGAGTYIAVNFNTLKKDFPILADLAGENEEIPADSTDLKELDVNDPDANPDGEAIAEPIPDEEVEQPAVEEEPAPAAPIPNPKKEEKPKPVVKPTPKPVVKPIVKPVVKPISKPAPSTNTKPAPPKIPVSKSFPKPDLNLPFHIIAGSFGSEANAKNLGNQLRAKGMNQVSIGEQNGMFRVSVKGYATKEEASAALSSVQSAAPGSWVYNWK